MTGTPDHPPGPATVLFAHSGLDWIRGSERCLLDLVAGLDRRHFRPVVWCDSASLAAEARALGAEVEQLAGPWPDSGETLLPDRAAVRLAHDVVRRHGARLVHANNELTLRLLLPAARAARIPTVVHLHLPTNEADRCYNAVHQAALVVGVSRSAAQGALDDGMPAGRVRVIYNGVDPRRLSAGDATGLRASLGIGAGDVVVAAVGSLIARKGVDALLHAFALLRWRDPRARLLIVGDGVERPALEALAASLGLTGVAHFLGERRDAGAVLRDAADVAVSAAREEAFPLNLLEAALFGLPIAASAIAPHRESVVEGVTGLLATPDDPAALADALHTLTTDPTLRRRMGEAGRARVEREFLVTHYVQRFEAAYAELLRRPASSYGWLRGTTWPPVYWRWVAGVLRRRLGLAPTRRPEPAL